MFSLPSLVNPFRSFDITGDTDLSADLTVPWFCSAPLRVCSFAFPEAHFPFDERT